MSTVPSEEHVVLMPGDANRTGQFWHRNAIPAVHFEAQFGFGVFGKDQGIHEAAGGPASGAGVSDGFAFWYVYEPYASVYPRSPEAQATWNLVGYKSNPKGFGVVFKVLDRTGHVNPSISCVHNTEDGRTLAEEVPTPSAFFYQYRNQPAVRHRYPRIGALHTHSCAVYHSTRPCYLAAARPSLQSRPGYSCPARYSLRGMCYASAGSFPCHC